MKLQEWQAILLAYGVLLVGAETSAGPLASLMAWGVAVTYLLDASLNKSVLISNLFPSNATIPSGATPAQAAAAPSAVAPPGQAGPPGQAITISPR